MFASDYQVVKDHLSEYSKWNTISCDTVSHDQPQHTTYACSEPTPTVWSPDSCTEAKCEFKQINDGLVSQPSDALLPYSACIARVMPRFSFVFFFNFLQQCMEITTNGVSASFMGTTSGSFLLESRRMYIKLKNP